MATPLSTIAKSVLASQAMRNKGGGEDDLALVPHPKVQVRESGDGEVPDRPAIRRRLPRLEDQRRLGVGPCRSDKGVERTVQNIGVGAHVPVEGPMEQSQLPAPLFVILGGG
ncbi:MAG TPA: hypothetical protein VHS97_21445, partial [Isosphaeraceae bacterium]|nr:hypothetical protein [Isosphaeraceae bacterium]